MNGTALMPILAREMLTDLANCFTNRSNPWHNDKPNVNFQRDLNLMIEADREYLDNSTLSRRCDGGEIDPPVGAPDA
jgi:nucleoid-associated protein YejK